MQISLIVAYDKNRVIGKNNQLPWRLPADLKHFKTLTMGKPIVMGRKTFESIGRPLPGRRNVVISSQSDFKIAGCDVYHSIEAALTALQNEAEIMVIGGARVYEQFLKRADCIYLTVVDAQVAGDAFFPTWDQTNWQLVSQERFEADEKNAYGYCFQEWRR